MIESAQILRLLVQRVDQELLPTIQINSITPHNPVEVHSVPAPWQLLGAGNYAAVFCHSEFPDQVIKVYAPSRSGFDEEVEVYRRLGAHPTFSTCLYVGKNFLVLKRLYGTTLYDCLHKGLTIPKQVIQDVDQALNYARSQGLNPYDVHGRNVMMWKGRGFVVDVSDFLHRGTCLKWTHLKRAYYWVYRPILAPFKLQVPYFLLDMVRRSYRLFCRSPGYRHVLH